MGSRESDVYEATKNFLAAMQGLQKVFRFDTRVFAQTVDELRGSNPVAAKFQTYAGVAGRTCGDFDEGLTMAQSGCLCFFQAPTYNFVEITFSSRVAPKFIGDHPEAARELASHYLERLNHANYQVR